MSNEIIFHRGDKLKIIDIIDGDDLDRNCLAPNEIVQMADINSAGRDTIIVIRGDGLLMQLNKSRFELHLREADAIKEQEMLNSNPSTYSAPYGPLLAQSETLEVGIEEFSTALKEFIQPQEADPAMIVHYGIRRDADGMIIGDDKEVLVANMGNRIVSIDAKRIQLLKGRSHTAGVLLRSFQYFFQAGDDKVVSLAKVAGEWLRNETVPPTEKRI